MWWIVAQNCVKSYVPNIIQNWNVLFLPLTVIEEIWNSFYHAHKLWATFCLSVFMDSAMQA